MNIGGFRTEESRGANNLLNLLDTGGGHGVGSGETAKKLRRYLINAHVGTLCRQNRGHHKLEWCLKVQFAVGLRVGDGKGTRHTPRTRHQSTPCFLAGDGWVFRTTRAHICGGRGKRVRGDHSDKDTFFTQIVFT